MSLMLLAAFNSQSAGGFTPTAATGGTIIDSGDYRYHTFTSSGTFTVSNPGTLGQVEYLVIGGGGAGGNRVDLNVADYTGGGGGAGEVKTATLEVSPASYNLVIGAGGAGGSYWQTDPSTSGNNTSAFGVSALGGGAGGWWNQTAGNPKTGGSGGGAYAINSNQTNLGADGTSSGGLVGNGGDSVNSTSSGAPYRFRAGGGGGAGGNAPTASKTVLGSGGAGYSLTSWPGKAVAFSSAGGGGGGGTYSFLAVDSGGAGASGGGNGAYWREDAAGAYPPTDSTPNTGSGGGGDHGKSGSTRAGNGGSGLVIIRYPLVKVA